MREIRFDKVIRGIARTARRSTSGVALLTTPRTTPPPYQMAATVCHCLPNDCHHLPPSAITCQPLPHCRGKIRPAGTEAFVPRRTDRPSISFARHWFGQTFEPRRSWIRSSLADETRENRSRDLCRPVTVCHIVHLDDLWAGTTGAPVRHHWPGSSFPRRASPRDGAGRESRPPSFPRWRESSFWVSHSDGHGDRTRFQSSLCATVLTTRWIPASAGMTDLGGRVRKRMGTVRMGLRHGHASAALAWHWGRSPDQGTPI